MSGIYSAPSELVLGTNLNVRVPEADQRRQRAEVEEILRRLCTQPGVILADEVGMGKTFVALAVAYSIAVRNRQGPVIIMVPANLVDKWEQDLKGFCELYLENRHIVRKDRAKKAELTNPTAVRYGVARHSVELMKLLDDPPRERCHLVFLAQGAMSRQQTDRWVRLALIAECLRTHARGKATRLIEVKKQIHRFLAKLLHAIGVERAQGWGEKLWKDLLKTTPDSWMSIYNKAVVDENRRLTDDPVPKSVVRALQHVNLKPLAEALALMPIRATGGENRVSERISRTRSVIRKIEEELWKVLLARTRWRSPLLVMDEAHHLKNPRTSLARQLQSVDSLQDLQTGDGAMARSFDRMLFLTATPFQLGHIELVRVLERFGDVRWETKELGKPEIFRQQLAQLQDHLNDSQRTAIALQRCWSRLTTEDCEEDIENWWLHLLSSPRELLTNHQRAVIDAYQAAKRCRINAQTAIATWIIRHNKGNFWTDTGIRRRERKEGASIYGFLNSQGIPIPSKQLLPFFLAARSAVIPGKDLLGEALSSSFEAFRFTRRNPRGSKDEQDEEQQIPMSFAQSDWYLREFDLALTRCTGSIHPKVEATVKKVVDLWEAGEKVLVFAFYRQTCRALRFHISNEIEKRNILIGGKKLRELGHDEKNLNVERILEKIQRRFFDDLYSKGRQAIDSELDNIIRAHVELLVSSEVTNEEREQIKDVMRRYMRVPTTLARCFPFSEVDSENTVSAVQKMLSHIDGSGLTWSNKFHEFVKFLTLRCSSEERTLYLEACLRTQTGGIRVDVDQEDDQDEDATAITLANVQVATGVTRREKRSRLMRAFNTPFFPDILVCSQVMGEGVDLQRFCRHVIHHDLAWNPSTIEQRTGRIDRLGCKAEGRQPIVVYMPYLDGTADERQYKVMSDREKWFRVVMGQNEVARLITEDNNCSISLPNLVSEDLCFNLGLDQLKNQTV